MKQQNESSSLSHIDKYLVIPLKNNTICSYLDMLNDSWRNKFYIDALQKHAKDKIVVDMGTGTGILAYYALLFGAKFVYCFEYRPDMALVAQKVLEKKFSKDRFKVIASNFWNTNLDEIFDQKIDILVSETVGPGLFDNGMINTWFYVKPYLSDNAISIPDRLHCDLWIYENSQLEAADTTLLKCLDSSAVHDNDFVNLLLQTDRETMLTATQWQEVNKIKFLPDKQISDIVSYTLDHGPVVTHVAQIGAWMSGINTGGINANIDFEIDLSADSTVIVVNKISFENQTLYLKDAKYMPWKYAPTLNVTNPGRYKFSWQNHEFEHMSNHEWKYKLVA